MATVARPRTGAGQSTDVRTRLEKKRSTTAAWTDGSVLVLGSDSTAGAGASTKLLTRSVVVPTSSPVRHTRAPTTAPGAIVLVLLDDSAELRRKVRPSIVADPAPSCCGGFGRVSACSVPQTLIEAAAASPLPNEDAADLPSDEPQRLRCRALVANSIDPIFAAALPTHLVEQHPLAVGREVRVHACRSSNPLPDEIRRSEELKKGRASRAEAPRRTRGGALFGRQRERVPKKAQSHVLERGMPKEQGDGEAEERPGKKPRLPPRKGRHQESGGQREAQDDELPRKRCGRGVVEKHGAPTDVGGERGGGNGNRPSSLSRHKFTVQPQS